MTRNVKILLGLKFIGAVLIVLAYFKQLHIGDVVLSAQSHENIVQQEEDDGFVAAEKAKGSRKSYLEDLFSTPRIDTANVRQEEAAKYLAILERRQQQVEERISLLQAREQRLIDIERGLDEKVRRLEEEKRFFLETVQKEKEVSKERSVQLVEFYKKMPAKAAAPVFEQLDKDLVVELFNKMPQKQITAILAQMSPEVSVKLTEYYGRMRSGREYEILREINRSLTDEFQNCKGL